MINLQKIEWGGFYSFPKTMQSFEFKPGFHLVVGHNGAGKSSFLNLLCLVLFDKSPSLKKKEAINENEKHGRIELFFAVDGKDYRILYERTSKTLNWILYSNDSEVVTGSETGKYMEKLLGFGYDQFVNSFYLTQNSSFNLKMFYGDPGDRLSILSKIFGLDKFIEASARARMGLTDYEDEYYRVDKRIISDRTREKDLMTRLKTIDTETTKAKLKSVVEEKDKLSVEHNEELNSIQKGLDQVDKEFEELDKEFGRIQQEQLEVERIKLEITNKIMELQEKANKYKEYQGLIDEYVEKGNKFKNLSVKKDELNTEISRMREDRGHIEGEISVFKARLAGVMVGEGICDKCGSEVSQAHLGRYSEQISGEIESLEQKKQDLTLQIAETTKDLPDIKEELYDLTTWLNKFEQEYAEFIELDEELDMTQVLINAEKNLSEYISKAKNLSNSYDKLVENKTKLVDKRTDLTNAERELNKKALEIKDLTNDEKILKNRLSEAEELDKELTKAETQLKQWEGKAEALKNQVEAHKFWVSGFKEIATLKLHSYVAGVNSEMEKLLESFGMNLWIDVLEKKASAKDEFSLDSYKRKANLFVSGEGKEKVPIAGYSGGQKQLLSLAMIMAMGNTVGSINYLALDEVFGSLDPNNRVALLDLLNMERTSGLLEDKCVLMVTHDEEVKSNMEWDSVIEVDIESGGSKINVRGY